MTRRARVAFLLALTAVAAVIAAALPRIPQDAKYFQFADHRAFFGVPNFFDVASNAGFLVVGVLGLALLARRGPSAAVFADERERAAYWLFFAALVLVAAGSTYHHLAPDVHRLFWDRLPMAVAFVAFLSAVIAERVSTTAGTRLLWPLAALGALSTIYWRWTERQGAGDLRLYGFVQFYPLLVIPLLALLFPSRYTRGRDLWIVLLMYGLAKVTEFQDPQILTATGGAVSGHTLKHVLAAWGLVWVVRSLRERRVVVS